MQRKFFLTALAVTATFLSLLSFNSGSQKITRLKSGIPEKDTINPVAYASDHQGKMVISEKGILQFSSGLDNDYYLIDSVNRTGYLYLETSIGKFINGKTIKTPLNLSIVIDRSGSMSGAKMENAKQAAKEIVQKLDPEDFISVVVYDDKVTLVQPPVLAFEKKDILTRISRIETGGSTNLWGGTDKGYQQVKTGYNKNCINRVLLISDGLANAGITNLSEIRERVIDYKDNEGITLSTFGVGLDYNEVLMTDMAESGAGNYYFIDDPEKMAHLFDKELNGLLKVAVQNVELNIQLPRGVRLTKSYGGKFVQNGQKVTVQLRDLFSDETRGMLFRFSIDDYANIPLKFITTIGYDDVSDQKRKMLTNENVLLPSADRELYSTHNTEKVIEQTVLFTSNESMEMAMKMADKGDYENARQVILKNQSYLKINKGYVSRSGELQKMEAVNDKYYSRLKNAESLDTDSVKYLQKSSRASSYEIRTKKKN